MSPPRWGPLAGLVVGVLAAVGASSLPTVPSESGWLSIAPPGAAEKPPVWFSHRVHEAAGVACERCHHEYQGKRNLWRQGQPVKKCGACHGPRPRAGRLELKEAFHRQCKGCHLAQRQTRRPAGPVHCRDCHRRS
ncbi:MAG: cytochrome c3 family protein [Deltaproteobacteria bacterium]|nr:cytochrome c3 family protein [Deltaproteobacteria bacterium]